ncbi:MAG: MOSC domain-containing protein [Rhodobacteraceae bacterium]|nr:MOSC domain-containing protein [Paracoccaceae bacterium]
MTGRLAAIWRHPIKAHGRETLRAVRLTANSTMPWDRTWAVAHEAAKLRGQDWVPCANFTRGAKVPALMALTATLDTADEMVTLRHPDLSALRFAPDREAGRFLDWIEPLMPEDRARPVAIVRAAGPGFTDSPFPSLSLTNTASLAALERQMGRPLSRDRFRSNLWVEGWEPFAEFDLVGRQIRIGTAILSVEVRIGRCLATAADPETGRRDADTLGALKEGWGHTQFGVYATVVDGGEIAVGDRVELLG